MWFSLKAGLVCSITLISLHALSVDLTNTNIAYQYDLAVNLKFEYRVIEEDGNIAVIYKIPIDTSNLWTFAILGQNNYNSTAHDTLSIDRLDTISFNKLSGIFKYLLPEKSPHLLLFTFSNLSHGVSRIFDVKLQSPGGFPSFYPVNESGLPIFKNYITSNSVEFKASSDELHAFRYWENFDPADPPMGEMSALAPTIEIDTSIFFGTRLENLKDQCFYLFQSDTLSNNAITLLKCPTYFPELKQFEELIKPMRYITTSPENQSLLNASDPRKAFESFWINTYGTKFRAKGAIKYFYKQIEEANLLFTDYKPGWKTDRGILYVIYGLPDVVTRTDRSEIWKYNSGDVFEFIKLATLFTPSLYSLHRTTEYEKSWYLQVGEIRKGQ